MSTNHRTKKSVSLERLNAWRMHRQWLDRPYTGKSIVELIHSIGWIYSPGSSTPYLALWARMASFRIADLNRLVFDDRRLVQMETLRGCTMLLPREYAPIALRIRSRTFSELAKQARSQMPITECELEQLKVSVLRALQHGPRTNDQIRDAVPSSLVRAFGPECKRLGLAGSLSLAINLLKEECRIIKLQTNRRLDSNDYSYALLSEILPEVDPFGLRIEQANARLAAQYFKAEGAARVKDFAWWAGINVTDAMRAASEVHPPLVPIPVEGMKDDFLISATELATLQDFSPGETSMINLIPYRDTFLKGQREIVNRFVRQEHADKPFSRWKGKLINDPLATVICDGEVVGVWEWSSHNKTVDYLLFDSVVPKPVERTIRKRATELSAFIQNNLGEIRLQGLDYGPHQMTGIHQLKEFWGRGVQVDASAV